jgi:hypothetical protein
MKRFITISIGLFFGSLSLIDRVNAQSSTTTIDNTPKYPSICEFSQNRRGMVYGKLLGVTNISGDPAVVVTDRNYTSTVGGFVLSFLTKQKNKTPEYFSIWSNNEILFQTENLPHSMSKVFIKINDQKFPLEYSYTSYDGTAHCRYGNETRQWSKKTDGYELSEDIKQTLRVASGKSNVKIVYHSESGNQAYATEFDISDGTIQSWQRIDKFYRQMAEKNKPLETQSVEKPESNTSPPINSEEE